MRWLKGKKTGTDDVENVLVVVLLEERPRRTSGELLLDLIARTV